MILKGKIKHEILKLALLIFIAARCAVINKTQK
jgi:hypothetical protein